MYPSRRGNSLRVLGSSAWRVGERQSHHPEQVTLSCLTVHRSGHAPSVFLLLFLLCRCSLLGDTTAPWEPSMGEQDWDAHRDTAGGSVCRDALGTGMWYLAGTPPETVCTGMVWALASSRQVSCLDL